MIDFYVTAAKQAVQTQLQYRASNYLYMIGMVTEPVIYLVIWSSIAREQGGSIEGYTPGTFAAYYIVWTLVRNINIVFTPYGWEERIREGSFSATLLKPINPIHHDLAGFIGWKVVVILFWIPIAVVLTLVFEPELDPRPLQYLVFPFTLVGAYLIRSLFMWSLGLVTFWTTRVAAFFEALWVTEMLMSGRIVPLAIMPDWVQTVAYFFPFRWVFGYPITALVGPVSNRDLLVGLLAQAAWALGLWALTQVVFKRAVRHYGAVGG